MPPVNRTDFPYPLRTIDGEVDATVDSLIATTIDVTGDATIENLYVNGVTTVVGGIIDLAYITCDTLDVINAAHLNSTLLVDGVSTLGGGVSTTAITCNTINTNSISGAVANLDEIGCFNLQASQNITANQTVTANDIVVNGTTDATNPFTGSVILEGGIGVSKNIIAAGRIESTTSENATSTSTGAIRSGGGISSVSNIYAGGDLTAQVVNVLSTTQSTLDTNGALKVAGGVGVKKNIFSGGKIQCQKAENATSLITGAILAPFGGISCALDLFAGGDLTAQVVNATSTTDSTTSTTGALLASGGLGVVSRINAGSAIQSLLNENATDFVSGAFRAPLGGISCAQDLMVGGQATVSNDIISDAGAIVGNSYQINATSAKYAMDESSNTLRINPATDFANVNIRNLTTLNTFPFKYEQGYFTPALECLAVLNPTQYVKEPWLNITSVVRQDGYFQRVGNLVTCWYSCEIIIDGLANDFASNPKHPCVSNLPYACKLVSNINLDTTAAVTDPSFPNGYLGGVGIPAAILMPYPYEATVLTKDFPWNPDIPPVYPPTRTWIPDGKTIVFSGTQIQVGLAVLWEANGTLYNFNILSAGVGYNLKFNGQVQYFSDE